MALAMKILLKLGIGLAVVVAVLVVIAYFLPRRYSVQRSLTIQATAETVYGYTADLRRWKDWGVWYERDPQMTIEYSETTDEVGGWTSWVTQGTPGKMTLTMLRPPSRVGYRLEFPAMNMTSSGMVEIVPGEAGVNVTLSDTGDLGRNPIRRWFGLFLDGMLGPDFEAGLEKLKRLSERGS